MDDDPDAGEDRAEAAPDDIPDGSTVMDVFAGRGGVEDVYPRIWRDGGHKGRIEGKAG